jgi:hydroxylaminobenzene mutase
LSGGTRSFPDPAERTRPAGNQAAAFELVVHREVHLMLPSGYRPQTLKSPMSHPAAEAVMNLSEMLSRQGRRLLQLGVALFLFTSFEGFVIPALASPNLGRSVHTLSGFTGVLFLAMGLMWPMLNLGTTAARMAFWLLVYSALTTIAGFVVAALWGAGGSIMPIAAQGARGSNFQETVIQLVIDPAAPTGIIAFALILWGLRDRARPAG